LRDVESEIGGLPKGISLNALNESNLAENLLK